MNDVVLSLSNQCHHYQHVEKFRVVHMTTFNAQKKTYDIVTAREYLKRRSKNPKSVEGAKILISGIGSSDFGKFAIKRQVPEYEVLPELADAT
jgi:hypothetical protein